MNTAMFNPQNPNCRIAVIGIGCQYPGAHSPLQLWENIMARRRQFREMPDVRLPNSEYYDPDASVPDKTYQNKAAVLDGYQFDWLGKRIPKQTYESTDIVHWLALDTAIQALQDANYQKDNIPKEKTGVILGNTLTGEFTRSNQMRLRWPYVKKALRASARKKGLTHILNDLEPAMEETYKSVFSEVAEDTLAGGLANTIAGRVCNYLDIHGGGYIVDGACSSSLLAIVTAANYLELKQMDIVIAGGVDISLDTFELIGFAKTKALTPDEMRVYDIGGKGFLPGEGCGMVVLKRLEDAKRDKDPIYAIINGWGISSDGKGGITAPSAAGQSRALKRAYEKAQFNPLNLDFIEGHGTGTTVGDKIELEGISIALSSSGEVPPRNCGVTSFKSIVGHTKAAAGIGALIKTVMAVNRRVLPPTAGLKEMNPIFNDKAKGIFPITHGEIRTADSILYAGVSAMGFGGINSHVVMESAGVPNSKLEPSIPEEKLLVSNQTHELYLYAGKNREALIEELRAFETECAGMSYAEMQDLASYNNQKTDFSLMIRAAIIADTPFDLQRKLKLLIEKLTTWDEKSPVRLENNMIVASVKKENLRIGAVFPGQGSQKINMAYKLSQRHSWLQEIVLQAAEIFTEEADQVIPALFKSLEKAEDPQQIALWQSELKQTQTAQPAITLASLIWYEYLSKLGLNVSSVSGHSLGELMAFYAAGLISKENLLRFAVFRGKSMAVNGSGSMASLQCSAEKVTQYISGIAGYVTIANINGPEQTVVSGETDTIKEIIRMAQADQVGAIELPVSAAFHSQLVAEVANEIQSFSVLHEKLSKNPNINLISSTNGKKVDGNVDLNTYFSFQAVNQVDFIHTVQELEKNCDVIIEVGPGKVLSGLISNISTNLRCFPVEMNADDDLSLNILLGNLFVMGSNIRIQEIYNDRLIREFVPAYRKTFLINPLERPFSESDSDLIPSSSNGMETLGLGNSDPDFNEYLKIRSNFIRDMVETDYRYYRNGNPDSPRVVAAAPPRAVQAPSQQTAVNGSTQSGVRKLLLDKIESLTGFASDGFTDQMKLLDDFNLDSIKSGSLLNGLAKSLNITGKISSAELSNASLADIIIAFEKVTGQIEKAVTPQVEETPQENSANDIPRVIYKMLADRTGFPPEALRPDYKLLDDLNLDSIKAGAFIAEVAKKFNIRGKVETANLANANIEDIIETVTRVVSSVVKTSPDPIQKEQSGNWVNAFSVSLTEEKLLSDPAQIKDFWKARSIVLVYAENEEASVNELAQSFKTWVSKVITVSSKNLHLITSLDNSCVLVVLPADTISRANLTKTVGLISDISGGLTDSSLMGFLQWNDGQFSKAAHQPYPVKAKFSCSAFAASIHHERPDVKIRVIEADNQLSRESVADIVLKEFITEQPFEISGYDDHQIRRKMKYEPAFANPSANTLPHFDESDLVLATGGAKGITAECVFAFARKYRCKTVLLGSSPLNDEISATLKRYESENLAVRYFSCDISNQQAVEDIVKNVQAVMGAITMVIHGAGKNVPRRAEKVTLAEALDEIAPKLLGVMNLCDALKDSPIKAFVALTSIIGVTGMPGNSWYAFSNENVDLYLREAGKRQNFMVRTLAYSIWGEIGMGERMGSTRVLANMGIGAISPILGVEQFLKWIENHSTDQQIVITAGLGGLDTWNLKKPEIPAAKRYLTEIKYLEPGREIIARAKLNRITDLYIDDHNYGGSLLFPTVFGLEAMAESAFLLTGLTQLNSVIFENISLQKPIVVPENGEIEIGIKATIIESALKSTDPVRIYAGVSTEHAGFSSFHFSAEILFNAVQKPEKKSVQLPKEALKISPVSDLYTWLLFQGRRFQNIKSVYQLASDRVTFTTTAVDKDPAVDCFADSIRTPLLLGSPLLRDVLLQSVQIFLTGKKYLPVAIKRWQLSDISKQANGGIVVSTMNELREDRGICDVEFIIDGEVNEKIEGYQVKALEMTSHYPTPEKIANMESLYMEPFKSAFQEFEHLLDEPLKYGIYKHHLDFNYLNRKTRHQIEDELFHTMLSSILPHTEKDLKLTRSANGKPIVQNSELKVSISHSRSVLLMLTGNSEQGCDLEFIEKRSRKEWNELLDNKYDKLLEQLQVVDKDLDTSATRIWCIKEALIKSAGSVPLSIQIQNTHKKGVVFKVKTGERDNIMILTFTVDVLPTVSAVVATIVSLKKESGPAFTDNGSEQSVLSGTFDNGLNGFTHQFYTTFKDCKAFYGKTHFTNYPDWMGSLRELVLAPISSDLLKDLGTGEYGMVTNTSEVQIFNEAETLNPIIGNLWITGKSELENSFIDLNFEFLKQLPGTNSMVRLAKCNLSTTWVKIESRGIVKKAPIPAYFMQFLDKHLLRKEITKHHLNGIAYPSLNNMGKVLYQNNHKIRPQILLLEKEFQTGISNGNTVGNLYYSNYYHWQAETMEHYLYQLVPEIMISNGRKGDFITLEANVKHLQEAMPFETIIVHMYVDQIFENGFRFYFEYFSKEGNVKRKLAFGSNSVIFATRTDEKSVPGIHALPEKLQTRLNSLIPV